MPPHLVVESGFGLLERLRLELRRTSRRPLAPKAVASLSLSVILLASVAWVAVSAADRGTFDHFREALPPLRDARTWVLTGKRLANGGCQYRYPTEVTEVPQDGWELRSIAVDTSRCRKLMEEGTPTVFSLDLAAGTDSSEVLPGIALAETVFGRLNCNACRFEHQERLANRCVERRARLSSELRWHGDYLDIERLSRLQRKCSGILV